MIKLLDEESLKKNLEAAPGWERVGDQIQKAFALKDFASALQFVNRVGEIAEEMDHHPDILIHGYKNVTLTLSTHSVNGLTRLDFELAQKIDQANSNMSFK